LADRTAKDRGDGVGDAHVEIEGVRLTFGERTVFEDLSCRFARGRITVLMGGSGTGKSTALRMIAGLQRPDAGQVCVVGEDIARMGEGELKRVRRRLGMLFQEGALLDSMTVLENVGLPLREHTRLGEGEIREAVHDRLAAVGLHDVDELLPGELSGGMLRRVALARAIIMDPEIVLCDEPFSGLDPPNVERIEALFKELCRERGLTLIVTSHHMASSLRMSDQIVLLQHGRAVSGDPGSLATSPDPEIRDFLGADGAALAEHIALEARS
jgi:phospholipid/cholesterol/gamma-HCH transport system ATP-binding protein